MGNFNFLKNINLDLYGIIKEAEKLYCDEYFEQSITQTRRFGECVCKEVLGSRRTTEKTFDEMLATLKDKSSNIEQEKEFINDLYFLKREGNSSVHASKIKNDGMLALECLKRSFEIAINYALYTKNSDKSLLKKSYDITLLITGKKSKTTLAEKFYKESSRRGRTTTTSKQKKQKVAKVVQEKNKYPIFWILVCISAVVSIVLILTTYLLTLI